MRTVIQIKTNKYFQPPIIEMQPPPSTSTAPVKGDSPRELRNKAEKQRRDKFNQSIAQLAAIVPPVVATGRKMDKTSVLKLTAHYLRSHQHVFGESINYGQQFTGASTRALLGLLKGFILTTTYKGIVVVVSQNVQQYLAFNELDLIGQSIFNITHEDDQQILKNQLMPNSKFLGPSGELLIPDEPDATKKFEEALMQDKRSFIIRLKKFGQRTAPRQYINCHIEGSFRRSDKACRKSSSCCQQMVRRVRSRGYNTCPAGNDVVFVGLVRPTCDTFINDRRLESFRMEYRTRHSIDGEIIECESRIALVTGYMTHEVNGVNAMNFMHRDDVRWVIVALREMYDQRRLVGESCYRLMTKSGQFIYMQTRGHLDVDETSRAVTSFVCTNTVVDEHIGKHLIKLMKKKFMLLINNNADAPVEVSDESLEANDSQSLSVEDPRLLEKVILHLVTNLPASQPEKPQLSLSESGYTSSHRINIIPHKKERIVNAIEKIYSVIKSFKKQPTDRMASLDDTKMVIQNRRPSFSSSESESDSMGSLSSYSYDLSEPEYPLLTDAQGARKLKRKRDDDNDVSSKKPKMENPTADPATTSSGTSLQSDNATYGTQGAATWWSQEPGPSHRPDVIPEASSEAAQAHATAGCISCTHFDDDLLERLCAVQFLDDDHSCSHFDINEAQLSDSDLIWLQHVRSGSTGTATDQNNLTTDNSNYNALNTNTFQHYSDPGTQTSVNNFSMSAAGTNYSNYSESAQCLEGFSISDEENYSEYSDVFYLPPNQPAPMQYDASSSSSYVMDTTSGICSFVPKLYNDSNEQNLAHDNNFVDFFKPLPEPYDPNVAQSVDASLDFLCAPEEYPGTSSANQLNTSSSGDSGVHLPVLESSQNRDTLATSENLNCGGDLEISNDLYASIKDELSSINICFSQVPITKNTGYLTI